MKGLTPQQSHDCSQITFWIRQIVETAPNLTLQKICNAPAFRKLLIKLVETNLPTMEKHVATIQKHIRIQKRVEKEQKASKGKETVLFPVSSGISKKPRVNHAAKAAYLTEKLQLLPGLIGKYAGPYSRSDEAAEDAFRKFFRVQDVSGTEVALRTANGEASRAVQPKQETARAKGKKVDKATTIIDSDDEHAASDNETEPSSDEIDTARKDYEAYHTEQELTRGTASALEKMKHYCRALRTGAQPLPSSKLDTETAAVFAAGTKLSFDLIKDGMLAFASRTCTHQPQSPIRATSWNLDDPIGIYNAIASAATASDDAKIKLAYGQMQLYTSINRLVTQGRRSVQKHKGDAQRHQLPQLDFLDQYADEKVGPAAGREAKRAMRAEWRGAYYAGMNWLDMADMFEGTGVVFVFLVASGFFPFSPPPACLARVLHTGTGASDLWGFRHAGIGFYSVAHGFSAFQRKCFQYVAACLPSTRRLVRAIGSRALGEYCVNGRLARECVAGVRGATGLLGRVVGGDEEDEEDEEEIADCDEGVEDVDVDVRLEDGDEDGDEEMLE